MMRFNQKSALASLLEEKKRHLKAQAKMEASDVDITSSKGGRSESAECITSTSTILDPAIYHDVPTNITLSSSNASPTPSSSSPSSSPPSLSSPLLIPSRITLFLNYVYQFLIQSFSFFTWQSRTKKNKTESNNTSNSQNQNHHQQQHQHQQRLGITIVCISDTHGEHRKLSMPTKGDILIHAGDYTKFGKKEQLVDFNDWLGTLPYKTKIVVNGNHECNAMWKHSAKSLLSNAHLLINESMEVEVDIDDHNGDENNDNNGSRTTVSVNGPNDKNMKKNKKQKLKIHGTNFYWPSIDDKNPYFDMIDSSTDIVIAHCPALGYLDNNGFGGCPALLHTIQERVRPKLVISGHIHSASGIVKDLEGSGVTFVNAANAKGGIHNGHSVGKQPIILTL